MKFNIIDISPPIPCLPKFWFSSYGTECCWPIKLQDSLNVICQEKNEWWSLFLTCRKKLKFSTTWYYHFRCAYPGIPKLPKTRSLHIFATSSGKRVGWCWFICPQINNSLNQYHLIVLLWVCVARHAQSNQNNNSAILKENMKDKFDISLIDKLQRLLQIGNIISSGCGYACPNYPK